jgi:hypothetical protein
MFIFSAILKPLIWSTYRVLKPSRVRCMFVVDAGVIFSLFCLRAVDVRGTQIQIIAKFQRALVGTPILYHFQRRLIGSDPIMINFFAHICAFRNDRLKKKLLKDKIQILYFFN